jgi:hypothetical protein
LEKVTGRWKTTRNSRIDKKRGILNGIGTFAGIFSLRKFFDGGKAPRILPHGRVDPGISPSITVSYTAREAKIRSSSSNASASSRIHSICSGVRPKALRISSSLMGIRDY